MNSRWVRHAAYWAVLTLAGVVVVVALEGGLVRGAMLAGATVVISTSTTFIVKDVLKARRE